MPRLSLSEGKFAGLLLVAYEKGVEDMKLAVRVNPFGLDYELKEIGDKVSTFHVNEKVREEQHHIFHSWVEVQLREVSRLNRVAAGEAWLGQAWHGRRGLKWCVEGCKMNDIKNLCEAAIFFGAVLSFVSFFMAGAVARGAVGTMLSLFFALAGIGGLFVGYWGASRLPLAQNVGLVLERARELREDEAKLQAPARGRRVGGGSR